MITLFQSVWSIFRFIFPFYNKNTPAIASSSSELTVPVPLTENTFAEKDECEIWDEIMMNKRNVVRRNSKRFVIGDGEDDFTNANQLPDVTISECNESESSSVRTPEWAHGNHLVPGTTLT